MASTAAMMMMTMTGSQDTREADGAEGRGGGGGGGTSSFARGTKRPAESQFTDIDRFNKRLNALTIGGPSHAKSNLFIPKPITSPVLAPTVPPSQTKTLSHNDDQLMQVDDTPDRVYIHDLDAELADIESDEEKLIFLPDIEKKLSRLPRQVLEHRNDHENQELVLYSVPKSLTAGAGHDSVRKAIIESRHRAREKAAEEARHQDMNCKYDQGFIAMDSAETAHGYSAGYTMDNPDAMDMD